MINNKKTIHRLKRGIYTWDFLISKKEESRKRLPINVGFISTLRTSQEDEQDQVSRMQREISRLENENAIMKKRLKKLLNIDD